MNLIEKAYAVTYGGTGIEPKGSITASSGITSVTSLLSKVIEILLIVAGAAAVIYLVYSGILYITAAGNPDAAKKGQQGVINAVIGIIVIVAAYTIIRIATNLGQGTA